MKLVVAAAAATRTTRAAATATVVSVTNSRQIGQPDYTQTVLFLLLLIFSVKIVGTVVVLFW